MVRKITLFPLWILLLFPVSLAASPLHSSVTSPYIEGVVFPKDTLHIRTHGGSDYTFSVEVAQTPQQMQQGLMYRTSLAENSGMLFLAERERKMTMWMKNTQIPLDMLFISKSGIIESIAPSTVPESLTRISSVKPVFAVLEVNAGDTKKYGIHPGDLVLHSAFTETWR